MNLTLAQGAHALAHDLLLATYEPDAETPAPGSAAWNVAVEKVARHFLHLFDAHKHELLRSGPPPAMPAMSNRAAAATKALLLTAAKEAS